MLQFVQVFFSFPEDTALLTDEERGRLVMAMVEYAKYGKEPDLIGNERFLWAVHKAQIDRSISQYDKMASAHRAAGALGGRPKKSNGFSENQKNQMVFTETKKSKEEEKEEEQEKRVMEKKPRFSPPSIEDVRAYVREKGYSFDPEQFHSYYESVGWKIGGKAPMKSWQSACVTWQKREKGSVKKVSAQQYEQRTNDITDAFAQFTQEEIEEMMRDEC